MIYWSYPVIIFKTEQELFKRYLKTTKYLTLDGYNIIGKTGTAQVADTNGKGYLTGEDSVIRSIALMFPKDNPRVIIYGALKKSPTVNPLAEPVKEVIQNIAKYYNIYNENKESDKNYIEIGNYINLKKSDVESKIKELNLTPIIIGDGDTIVNQYPINSKGTNSEKIFLITNGETKTIPNLIGYSKSDVEIILNYLNVKYTITGHGYVETQSIAEGTPVTSDLEITINLNSKLKRE